MVTNEQFAEEYERSRTRMVNWLTRQLPHHVAEDIVQDVWVLILEKQQSFRGDCTLHTWFRAILRNVVTSYYRRRKPEYSLEMVGHLLAQYDSQLKNVEDAADLNRILSLIPGSEFLVDYYGNLGDQPQHRLRAFRMKRALREKATWVKRRTITKSLSKHPVC